MKFDVAAHTHHAQNSAGAVSTACHRPQRTYMGVHVRHDHGFRVPRPDLAAAAGTRDVCTACHAGRTADWAAAAVKTWLGHAPEAGRQQAVLAAARADPALARRASADAALAPIVRATLLAGLGDDPEDAPALLKAAGDSDPLLHLGAARAQRPAPNARCSPTRCARCGLLRRARSPARRRPPAPCWNGSPPNAWRATGGDPHQSRRAVC